MCVMGDFDEEISEDLNTVVASPKTAMNHLLRHLFYTK